MDRTSRLSFVSSFFLGSANLLHSIRTWDTVSPFEHSGESAFPMRCRCLLSVACPERNWKSSDACLLGRMFASFANTLDGIEGSTFFHFGGFFGGQEALDAFSCESFFLGRKSSCFAGWKGCLNACGRFPPGPYFPLAVLIASLSAH